MSAIIQQLDNSAGDSVYPVTKTSAVYDNNNNRLDNTLTALSDSLNGKVDVIIRSGESVSFDTKTPAYGSGIVFAVIGGYGSVVFAYSLNGTTVSIVDLSPITATGKITPSSNGTTITFSTTGRNTNYKIIDF